MTADLMGRIVDQARTYNELMLTIEETMDLLELTRGDPNAAIALGPGQYVPIKALLWTVLPDLEPAS